VLARHHRAQVQNRPGHGQVTVRPPLLILTTGPTRVIAAPRPLLM
jgi:hypothetical protein